MKIEDFKKDYHGPKKLKLKKKKKGKIKSRNNLFFFRKQLLS